MTNDIDIAGITKLIQIWDADLRIITHANYRASTSYNGWHTRLGIFAAIVSAVVGSNILASSSTSLESRQQIVLGFASFAAALLASLQTFLRLSERAENFRKSGFRFGSLLKEIEQIAAAPPDSDALREWCNDFRRRWDALSADSPTAPPRYFDWAKRQHRNKYPSTYSPSE